MTLIVTNSKSQRIVEINTIIFPGKRKIDWKGVERYLKQYVGKSYTIEETGDIIHIGSEFPDEFAHSIYNGKALGSIGKARANIIQALPDIIRTATDASYSDNHSEKHNCNAKYGWYRFTTHFTIPIFNTNGIPIGKNYYQGRIIIRHAADKKKYLYDIINIKKET